MLFAAWAAWLLACLVPALVLGPRVSLPAPYLGRETAPAALVAGAALFLVTAWPFWRSALGAVSERLRDPFYAVSGAVELAVLAAVAAPMAVVAWSVAGADVHHGPLAAAVLGLGALGLGIRVSACGMGPGAGRWLAFAAMVVSVGPVALAYAARETLGADFSWALDLSPVTCAVRLATDGWPDGAWPSIARVWLWPGVGAALAAAGAIELRHRATASSVAGPCDSPSCSRRRSGGTGGPA